MSKGFRRVLVANRGEIAVRILRTLKDLDIESVVVYSDADQNSLHVALADYAIRLPGVTPQQSYLNINEIIRCIHESEADAVHPGYGFLAENEQFAEAVEKKTQASFIGPSFEVIKLMGDKIEARKFMQKHSFPIVPGSMGKLSSFKEVESLASDIQYPLILKAAAGGGGRGMRIVEKASQLQQAYDSCCREAEVAFGRGDVFCERYLAKPRHIEFQILMDHKGHGVHLYERDCTIQRRYQKLIEESPSLFLNEKQRHHYGNLAVEIAKSVGYQGTGTIEFIAEKPDQLYFMEMNTRIQVEHPVTEMITGLDLVAEQIKIAQNQSLALKQKDISINGWSLEARINAEDPSKDFMPASGQVESLRLPQGPNVRVDTHMFLGYEIPSYYDSLLAKIVVWAPTRKEAIARLKRCLDEFDLKGVSTTTPFYKFLLAHKDFLSGSFTTHFVKEQKQNIQKQLSHTGDYDPHLGALVASVLGLQQTMELPSMQHSSSRWKDQARMEETTRKVNLWNGS